MLGFMIAVIAGMVTPQADEMLARPLARQMEGFIEVEPGEMRALAFGLVLLIAGFISAVLNSGSALGIILGGLIGLFGMRGFKALKTVIEGKPRT